MRLTLRTMLAYVDQILDPDTAREMRERIEASDRAEALMQRIEDCLQPRSRPETPPLDAQGLATDANSIAEYLDNTLPVEQVPEFERVCLDSDLHLAEVASCHHLLAQALDKKTHVPPALRIRLHALGSIPAAGGLARGATADVVPKPHVPMDVVPLADTPHSGRPPLTVPRTARSDRAWRTDEPVTEPRVAPTASRPWRSLAIAALVGFLLVTAGLIAFSDRLPWLRGAIARRDSDSSSTSAGGQADATDVDESITPPVVERGQLTTGDDRSGSADTGIEPGEVAQDTDQFPSALDGSPSTEPDVVPDEPAPNEVAAPSDGNSGPGITDTESTADAAANLAGDNVNTAAPSDVATTPPPASTDASDLTTTSELPADLDPRLATAEPVDTSAASSAAPATTNIDEPGSAAAAAAATATDRAAAIGPLEFPVPDDPNEAVEVTEELVNPMWTVANFDESDPLTRLVLMRSTNAVWSRLAPETQGNESIELLSLPVFRPRVQVDQAAIEMVGATRMTLRRVTVDAPATVGLSFGRIVVSSLGDKGALVRFEWADRAATLELGSPDSRVAIEVTPMRVPGTDPLVAEPIVAMELTVLDGTARWRDDGASSENLALDGQMGALAVNQAPTRVVPTETAPSWTNPKYTQPAQRLPTASVQQLSVPRQIDLDGAREIERLLTVESDPLVMLNQATGRRQLEVRSVAVRSLVYLGHLEPLVAALSEVNQKSAWPLFMGELAAAIARGPEDATAVQQALEHKYPGQGEELFRTLIGYHPEQLREGGSQRLVEQLESEELIQRIFAFETLREITGGKTFGYQPEDRVARSERTPRRARGALSRWRDQLDEGTITYAALPRVIELQQKVDGTTTE